MGSCTRICSEGIGELFLPIACDWAWRFWPRSGQNAWPAQRAEGSWAAGSLLPMNPSGPSGHLPSEAGYGMDTRFRFLSPARGRG
jgi:hypothetical protein